MATPAPTTLKLSTVNRGDEDKQSFLLQIHLKSLGFYDGEIDGKPGGMTGQALIDFETAHGLDVDKPGFEAAGPQVWGKLQELIGSDFWWGASMEPVEPVSGVGPEGDSMLMGVVNKSTSMLDSEVQTMIDVYQRVIDQWFRRDWRHVQLRLASEDSIDANEVQHDLTDGLDVEGALGYHTIRVVNFGGRQIIVPYARTNVASASADETFGHEIFETAGDASSSIFCGEFGEPDLERVYENCDPVSNAPHQFMGFNISCWVTESYLQGLNGTNPARLDSAHWFGESPRVLSVKNRVANGGFQIYRRRSTGEFFFEFGDYPPGTPWALAEGQSAVVGKPLSDRVRPMSEALGAGLPHHVLARCSRYASVRELSA